VAIALDIAATSSASGGRYRLGLEARELDTRRLIDAARWIDAIRSPSIEDPLAEDDPAGFAAFTAGRRQPHPGGRRRLPGHRRALACGRPRRHGAANTVLIKPNQRGTLTETKAAWDAAREGRLCRHRLGALGRDRGRHHRPPGHRLGRRAAEGGLLRARRTHGQVERGAAHRGRARPSALARAIGAGRMDEAASLITHAIVIAVAMGLLTTGLALGLGPMLFRAVGGTGAALDHALAYASILFGGAVLIWLANILGAALRGAGRMRQPAIIMTVVWVIEAPLSGLLMLGLGWGLAGAAIAYLTVYAMASAALLVMIARGGAGFRPRFGGTLRRALFHRILSVGAVATVMATIANLTVVLMTAIIAAHGTAAIAAYGVGVRLEFLIIPLGFGVGVALTSLVGRRVGAGDWAAARATAWRGGLLAGGAAGAIGLAAAVFPHPLARIFAQDPAVQEAIVLYLRWVCPSFGPFGLGMALYFAAQGAGRMRGPFVASVSRIAVAVGGGWLLAAFTDAGLGGAFAAVGAGLVCYGLLIAASVRPGVWR
jgi:putative MATE family efflux protein